MKKISVGYRTIVANVWGVSCPTNEIDWEKEDAQALKPTDWSWSNKEWRKRACEVGIKHYLAAHPGTVLLSAHLEPQYETSSEWFEVYREVPKEKQQEPLGNQLSSWFGGGFDGYGEVAIPALTRTHFPKDCLEALEAVGLLHEGSNNIWLPLDAPTELWERDLSGRWEETTHEWLKVIGNGWVAKIPMSGRTIRGGGDTNMYSTPSGVEVGGKYCAQILRAPHYQNEVS